MARDPGSGLNYPFYELLGWRWNEDARQYDVYTVLETEDETVARISLENAKVSDIWVQFTLNRDDGETTTYIATKDESGIYV